MSKQRRAQSALLPVSPLLMTESEDEFDRIRAAIGSLPDASQREAASENILLVELVIANERKFT